MKPRLLVLGALGVTVLLVALWWSTTRETVVPVTPPPAVAPPAATPVPVAKDDRHILKPMAPAAPAAAPVAAPRLAQRPNVFVRPDGTRVHDLRDQDPGKPSPVTQPTVQLLLATGAPLVAKCSEGFTAAGNRGRLTAVVSLEVVAGKLKVGETKINSDSIEDTAVKDCVKQAFTGMSLDAPAGQDDMTYRVALPFRVP